jgi:hypothetical protein
MILLLIERVYQYWDHMSFQDRFDHLEICWQIPIDPGSCYYTLIKKFAYTLDMLAEVRRKQKGTLALNPELSHSINYLYSSVAHLH